MSALSVQARGRNGPGLHTAFLSGRVNTLGSVLNKCHSQQGRSGLIPPARLRADNPCVNPRRSDPAVACGSGVAVAGEESVELCCPSSAVGGSAGQTVQVHWLSFTRTR